MLPLGALASQPPSTRLNANRLLDVPALPPAVMVLATRLPLTVLSAATKWPATLPPAVTDTTPGSGPNAPEPASDTLVLVAVGRKLVTLPPAERFTLPPAAVLMPPRRD